MTTVFSAYVTARGQAWADFDVYMPERWARDAPRRRAAGIPADLEFATKPQLAIEQVDRLTGGRAAAGLGRRSTRCTAAARNSAPRRREGRACVRAIIPCDYQVPLPSGAVIRADAGRGGRRVRAALVRERVQGTARQRLGDDRDRRSRASTC